MDIYEVLGMAKSMCCADLAEMRLLCILMGLYKRPGLFERGEEYSSMPHPALKLLLVVLVALGHDA